MIMDFESSRVYLGPCGIGLGHAGRIIPVARELRSQGAEVMFSTYLEAVEFVRRQGFPVVRSPAMSLASDSTGRIDLKATVLNHGVPAISTFIRQITAEMEFMKAFRPDVVVSDSRLSTVVAGKLLGLPVALVINQFRLMVPSAELGSSLTRLVDGSLMTVLSGGWGSSDVILIPDFPMPYTICIDSLRIPQMYRDKVRMVGFILEKGPGEVHGWEAVRKTAGATGEDRLIYAAISGPRQEREPLIRMLEPIFEGFPERYKVAMSRGIPGGGSEPSRRGNLTGIPWVEDRYQFLKASNIVVGRGGHNTIMQAICYRKPSIIIPTPNHTEQYANARRAKELGLSEAIHQEDVNEETLLNLADRLLSDEGYERRLGEIASKGMANGLDNAVEAISELLLKWRSV
jgi:UDP:flavonoid glycosyltransferase YjiC (YdhE family)